MSEDHREHDAARSSGDAGEVTVLLAGAAAGSTADRDRLLQIVYDELRVIARSHMRSERPGHTLGATALVNESYLRLFRVAGETAPASFEHRHAFYKAAATAMRRILIDHARARAAGKRARPASRGGGDRSGSEVSGGAISGSATSGGRISVDLMEASVEADPHDLLSLDDALSRLEQEDERAAAVVRLRFFGGRQIQEIADMLNVSDRTVKRDWEFARARLQQFLEDDEAQQAKPEGGQRDAE